MSGTNKIEAVYDEYKLVKDKFKALQHDYNSAVLKKEANDKAIKEQQDKLTAVLNEISGEKLAWAQEKATQERELAEKQDEVNKILAKEKELDKKEADIAKRELDITEKLKQKNAILLEVKSEKTENRVIMKEAEAKVKDAEKIKAEAEQITNDFKAKILEITKQRQEL